MPVFLTSPLTASLAGSLMQGFAALLILLACLPLHAEDSACEIVIGSCHRAPLSAEGKGVIDKLVEQAFHRIGKRACVNALPCERSLMNANSGAIDGDILRIPGAIAARYPNLVEIPEVLYPLPMNGFSLRKDIHIDSFDDLLPLRVGHIIGWKILEDRVKAADVLRARGLEELFSLLADGRVDIVIYERLTGLDTARKMGLPDVRAIDPPLIITPQYLVLHQKHRALIEPLASALRAMKADGSYARAFRTAGLEPPASK